MAGGGEWGAKGGAKHPFELKGQCCAFNKWHEPIQSTREAQTAVRSSLVPHGHAVLLTHPRTTKCTLVVSQHRQKAVCKSRPGNLLSSARCFWIVHECAYHVQGGWVGGWGVGRGGGQKKFKILAGLLAILLPRWTDQNDKKPK